jgi:nucleoside-diphosphate-sugar epimerase
MKPKKFLVTGEHGYLAHALITELGINNVMSYGTDVREYRVFSDLDTILHFASPSDHDEFKDKQKTASTIINGTINLLKVAKYNNAKFVFASTMGVYSPVIDDVYSTCKLAMENYIKSVYNKYVILRIPRVYSKCRKKGLMRQIRENTIPETDMNNVVEYITLQDFVNQTLPVLDQTNMTHEYKITQKKSIREIKQWIEK